VSALTLRPATPDDLPTILALLADDHLGQGRDDPGASDDPAYRAAFDEIAADPHRTLLVAERDGAVIGTLILSFLRVLSSRGGINATVEDVRIAGALRGTGLGSEMMRQVVEMCRARGCKAIHLKSHRSRTAAHRFYERLGFDHSHVGMSLKL
jgi:GNAT superfamily N-acetyltransferase